MVTQTQADVAADGGVRTALIDTDVHLKPGLALNTYLPERWRNYVWNNRVPTTFDLPRARAFACRTDSWPPAGGTPGSDLDFARQQLLDYYGMAYAVQNPLGSPVSPGATKPRDLVVAEVRAMNEWTAQEVFASDSRWLASLSVPTELASSLSVAEIERWAEEKRFVQILLASTGTMEKPLGDSKYWGIYEACEALDLPVAVHNANGTNVGGSGWASYYFQDHTGFAFSDIVHVASLIFEGVFDRFPRLKFVTVEGGWSWTIALAWRLDACWRVMRAEVPNLQLKPSEYLHEHVWYTTQPMEEPERRGWLAEVLERAGVEDRLMFSSDYPHWDFDSPTDAVSPSLPEHLRRKLFYENACRLYGLTIDAET